MISGRYVRLRQLNLVYDALIAHVHNYRGSVIGFAGDAMTCWFQEKDEGRSMKYEGGSRKYESTANSYFILPNSGKPKPNKLSANNANIANHIFLFA
jgi:hypothetical protein